ncbi:MAG TPA: MBL fold metallo-hydrolase [Candidatus Saccharimonadales bacterium]|nr:MBL fold metallo-hydrolase [Candidatus Saccharimonadales bacterium]
MGLRVTVLGSGSSGNLTLVEGPRGRIAIEMGLSEREASRRLRACGVEPRTLDAVFVSHEHADHVRGARLFSRRHGVPIFTTRAAAAAAGISASEVAGLVEIEPGGEVERAGMTIRTFSLPHDAPDTVGYVVEEDGTRLGYATDLGFPSALAVERLRGCQILVVEANHDLEMLRSGPYPAFVKQRVMSRHGHLSNEQSAELIREVVTPETQSVFLAHLSAKNNDGRLALDAGGRALRECGRDGVRLELTWPAQASLPVEA